jgi:hypothetical protein
MHSLRWYAAWDKARGRNRVVDSNSRSERGGEDKSNAEHPDPNQSFLWQLSRIKHRQTLNHVPNDSKSVHVRLGTFAASELDVVFSGYQPR